MSPIKSEPTEIPPEMEPRSINCLPDIKLETVYSEPDVKSETIEYTPETPPTKRLKTISSVSSSPSSKGKSKIENDDDPLTEQQLDTCGVCLLEEGLSLRGSIDCCDHYFCFVCIMEWAKVESRCPICKRRFSTIRRLPKDGVIISERIVNVPVRDQVHYYDGNATLGPSDPYSQVKCSICSLTTDDQLLLLCDLCDSAAHSYCVGLGATVPEDDWFCQDCTLSRDEHAKVETDATCDRNTCPSSSSIKFARPEVSVNVIVRESRIHEPHTSSVDASFNHSERTSTQPTVDRPSNARTLQRCLNVHARIKVLRDNWDGFRGGSLNFSSSFGDGQRQTTSLNQESASQNHPCKSNVSPDGGSYDTSRAWKMMDMAAKALGRNKSSVDKVSKHPVKEENKSGKVRPNPKYFGGLKDHERVGTCKSNNDPHRFQMLEQGTPKSKQKHVACELPSSRKIIAPAGQVKNHQNLPQRDCVGATSDVDGSMDQSLIAADKCSAKKEKGRIKKDPQLDRKTEDAKSEIQSLVKLNLKILSRDKKLDVDVFKEVARHATHSILGACGIEGRKAGFRSFEGLVCKHDTRRSTLMPTSCRECFFVFVKDVVATIASERSSSHPSKA